MNPTSLNHRSYSSLELAPATQLTYNTTLCLNSVDSAFFAKMSEIATLPPGFSKRNISANTFCLSLSGTRLMTQFEMMQSAMPPSRGIDVMFPSTKDTFSVPGHFVWFSRARASISLFISTPMARPWGPTFLLARKMSKPAPLPRSRTVSPYGRESTRC